MHEDHEEAVLKGAVALAKHGRSFHLVVRTKHKRGDWRWLAISSQASYRSADGSYQSMSLNRDVTDLVHAQRDLVESEERYRSFYTKTPGMLHSIDASGRLVEVSDRWLEVLGYERSEVIGRKSTDFLTAESRRDAGTGELPELLKKGRIKEVSSTV